MNGVCMKKVKVQICIGTTCYIMGASKLQSLEEYLPSELKNITEISGSQCLGCCRNGNYGKAPFVKINGEIMANATTASIIEKISKIAKQDTDNEN